MKTTQCERIIRHLLDYGSISSLEAITEYGILRLASRINDLKRNGVNIISETKTGKNRYGETTHYKVYKLAEAETVEKTIAAKSNEIKRLHFEMDSEGEVRYSCPYCGAEIEAYSINPNRECPKCGGKYFYERTLIWHLTK